MATDFFSFYRSFDYLGLRIDNLKVESGIFIEKSHFRSSKKSDGNELHFRRKLGYGGHPTGLPNTSVPVCPSRKGRKKPKRKRKCEKLNFRSRFRRPVRTGLTLGTFPVSVRPQVHLLENTCSFQGPQFDLDLTVNFPFGGYLFKKSMTILLLEQVDDYYSRF